MPEDQEPDEQSEAIRKTWVPVGTGIVAGLVVGIVVDVNIDFTFAPEVGAVVGGVLGFLFTRVRG